MSCVLIAKSEQNLQTLLNSESRGTVRSRNKWEENKSNGKIKKIAPLINIMVKNKPISKN